MVLPHAEWKRLGGAVIGTVEVTISLYSLVFFMQVIRQNATYLLYNYGYLKASCPTRNGKLL
jgi:hypothetical protein